MQPTIKGAIGTSEIVATTASPSPEGAPDLHARELYVNRELSLLSFQRRVLEEARDESNPLLERVKFLAIFGSNVDEFFMVRVAGLLQQVDAGVINAGPDGLSPSAQLVAIRREVKRLFAEAYKCLTDDLLPRLDEAGIHILDYSSLNEKQTASVNSYFEQTIFPVLTPLAFDPGRPFPHISSLSLNLAVLIRDKKGAEHFARVKVPDTLPQLVSVSSAGRNKSKRRRRSGQETFVWLEQVIAANLGALFRGMEIIEAHPFHVVRDADIEIKELEADDLLETIERGVRQRRFGGVVELDVSHNMPPPVLDILRQNLEVEGSQIYGIKGPVSLRRLMQLHDLDRPDLKDIPFLPANPRGLAETRRRRTTCSAPYAGRTSCCIIPSTRSNRLSIS